MSWIRILESAATPHRGGRAVCVGAGWAILLVAASASAQTLGNIAGTVTDSTGAPLLGVEITIDSADVHTFSNTQGAFQLGGVPYGNRTVNARRLGFAPNRATVDVARGGDATVTIRLKPIAVALAPVIVQPTRMNYTGRLAGYYERLEKRSNGYFITRDQIDHESTRLLGQLLQHVPGVTAVRGRGGITGIRLRGRSCWPLIWIDGTPMPSGEVDLDSFSPTSIHGIELYLGSTTAPSRYLYNRDVSSCGTILIWSRGIDTDPISPPPTPSVDLQSLISQLSVFSPEQVDKRATLDTTRLLQLSFPPSLFAAGVDGLVIAEFVVDTAGRVENGTVGIVSSTAPLFTDAVRVALVSASYFPAIKNGHPVRQLVQQPFEFSVSRQARPR
ncbi:MAG TPA: TonB family protein [Gemmatimonadaceae bacterium]|nr:TonB family protein [Gemmatimonadaceae bacterium]